MSVFIAVLIIPLPLIALYGYSFEGGINYLYLGFAIAFSILEVAGIIFLVLNFKKISLYEKTKFNESINIIHKVDKNYNFNSFKEDLINKAEKLTDNCYLYLVNRLKYKFFFFKENEINEEVLKNIKESIKKVKEFGQNVIYIEVESFKEEYEELISNILKTHIHTNDYKSSIYQINLFDNLNNELHTFNVKIKNNILFDINEVLKEELISKKISKRKVLYKIKPKKIVSALKIVGAILIVGSFLINLIPVNTSYDHNLIVVIDMVLFFIGTTILFIALYRNVDILNIIIFVLLSIYFVLSRLLIVHHEFIMFMVCSLVLAPLLLVGYYKFKNIHPVIIGLSIYVLIVEAFNLIDISYINSNDLRLFIPPLVVSVVLTGIYTFLILYKKTSKYFSTIKKAKKKSSRNGLIVTYIACCLIFTFLSGFVLVNTLNVGFTDLTKVEDIEVSITRKYVGGGKHSTYYFCFEYEGNKCEIGVPLAHYKHYEVDDKVVISLYPGALGIDYFYYHVELNNYYES